MKLTGSFVNIIEQHNYSNGKASVEHCVLKLTENSPHCWRQRENHGHQILFGQSI